MSDRQNALEKLAEQYLQETGVKIAFETYAPTDVYKNKISVAATASLLPDIFNPMADKKELASFIDVWKDIFSPKALA